MADLFPPDDEARVALEAFRAEYKDLPTQGESRAGAPVRVVRLDRPGAYLLVPIYDGGGLRGVVQLHAQDMTVESMATIRDSASAFLVSPEAALAGAQEALPERRGWGVPFLGWRPCRESWNSLRPLWVVPHAEGQVYLTQDGEVYETLTAGRGG